MTKNILKGGAENTVKQMGPWVIRMVAVEKTIPTQTRDDQPLCPDCMGTGTISHWSEIAYFDDRRSCARCDAGGRVATRIADIVKRARIEERLSAN